jgi:RHS repeat-associated protein
VSSYTTNASNELTANSNASYTYDSNGNTLTKTVGSNTISYTWDYENRLTNVTLPGTGGTVTFNYDPFGRRIKKSSSTTTSVFAYDGDNLTEETNSSGAVVSRYTQTQNIDEPLAMLRSSATSYYNADGLGSVTSLTNSSGAAAQTYTYDSYGNVTASSGSLMNPFQYTGRESDPETGLYYYRARYYDQSSGRFLAEDPLGFGGGDGNLYRYALGSPLMYVDPTGLTVTCTYNQLTGRLICTDDSTGKTVVNTSGYSGGGEGNCPRCVNNPSSQNIPDAGTIPRGFYTIGPGYTWTRPGKNPLVDTLPLSPQVGSSLDAFLRTKLLIHGGKGGTDTTASNGCIIIDPQNRHTIALNGGGTLHVVSGSDRLFPNVQLIPTLGP